MKNMTMARLAWIILAGLTMAAPAWARLGETPDACDRRYGLVLTQKGPQGCWALSREYKKNGVDISIRFITLSTGAKVAGWIAYSSITQEDREKIRQNAASAWTLVEETRLTSDMSPHTVDITKAHNKHVAETQSRIERVTGWKTMKCWMSPTVFAADNGSTLIVFTDAYLNRFEGKQDQGSQPAVSPLPADKPAPTAGEAHP